MDVHSIEGDDYFQQDILSAGGEQGVGPSAAEILTRVDLEIAFGFEKLLNLETLVMEIAHRAADIEPLVRDPQSISAEAVDKAFEFDVLYGIVGSEVNELDKLVGSIRVDIGNAQDKVSEREPGSRVTDKLHAATESLRQMQDLISTIRRECAKFDKVIQPSHGTTQGAGYGNGHMSANTTMQAEGQRNVLQMLEQSIASALDFEKKLCDSRPVVEELQMKLHHAEQESYFLEESIEALYERMFAAENASQLILGISKELIGKVNTTQFYLSASVRREGDLKSKLEQNLMKLSANHSTPEIMLGGSDNNASQEAVLMQTPSPPEFLTLRDKIQELEEWLRDSCSQPQWSSLSRGANEEEQNMTQSEISTVGNIINDLKVAISNAESRTRNAEARCTQLTQTNVQLYGELNSDRAGILEKRLKESDTQLEHAKASVDAVVEQQSMLKSSMSDMEQMIEDLKEKFLKAETRAENAESKCTLLTDTNLELSEELSFLRGRVESLENSLHQANQLKMSTAKDIGIKTKTITDLVAKLALERERLHLQIVTLTKKNKILTQKCRENGNDEATLWSKKFTANEGELRPIEAMEETVVDSSSTQTKATRTGNSLREQEAEVTPPLEDESGAESTLEPVLRSIEPTLLNWKCIFAALVVLLAAVLLYCLLYRQQDDRVRQLLGQF